VVLPLFRTGVRFPSTPLMGSQWSRRGCRNMTETCLDKQQIDAKNIAPANKIVRFSRQSAPVAA